MKLTEERLEPDKFSCGIGKSFIFNLNARLGNSVLFLSSPIDDIRTRINAETPYGTKIISACCLNGVSKCMQSVGRTRLNG